MPVPADGTTTDWGRVMARLRLAAIAAVIGAIAVTVGVASAATLGWRVIGTARASGDSAVASANGTASHPRLLAVRITSSHGGSVNGFAIVSCSNGSGFSAKSLNYSGHSPLLKLMPTPMKNSDSCVVIARGSSTSGGTVVVQILKQ
jgi:hypothetical protein